VQRCCNEASETGEKGNHKESGAVSGILTRGRGQQVNWRRLKKKISPPILDRTGLRQPTKCDKTTKRSLVRTEKGSGAWGKPQIAAQGQFLSDTRPGLESIAPWVLKAFQVVRGGVPSRKAVKGAGLDWGIMAWIPKKRPRSARRSGTDRQ